MRIVLWVFSCVRIWKIMTAYWLCMSDWLVIGATQIQHTGTQYQEHKSPVQFHFGNVQTPKLAYVHTQNLSLNIATRPFIEAVFIVELFYCIASYCICFVFGLTPHGGSCLFVASVITDIWNRERAERDFHALPLCQAECLLAIYPTYGTIMASNPKREKAEEYFPQTFPLIARFHFLKLKSVL